MLVLKILWYLEYLQYFLICRVHTSKVQNQRDPIKFICGECQGAFTNRGPLEHHVCDTNIKKDTERLYKCPRCSGVFKHGFFISHHKRSHGGFPGNYLFKTILILTQNLIFFCPFEISDSNLLNTLQEAVRKQIILVFKVKNLLNLSKTDFYLDMID